MRNSRPVRPKNGLRASSWIAAAIAAAILGPSPLAAQLSSGPPSEPAVFPAVFLDCQGNVPCHRDHFRTEIRFVNWALDREDAEVHVIATSQGVAGGGRRVTLDFIGRGGMAQLTDRLTYTTRGSDVDAEVLDGVTHALRLGLMRFAVQKGLGRDFDLRFAGRPADESPGAGVRSPATPAPRDRWNSWTFRVGLSGDFDLRETSTSLEFEPELVAERITEQWKVGVELEVNAERNRRQLSDGREIRDDRDEWEVEALVARSVSNHLSAGFLLAAESSVPENQDARLELAPAIEYNYFPYSISNRRQLTVRYAGGLEYSDYIEETIFRETAELRPQHQLSIRYNAREAWGNAGVGMRYTQYLNELELYRAELNGSVSFRITRGLDLTLSGSSSWVHDEIHVPLSEIPDEDILLGRQSLPSSYRYTGQIGIGYRFGSPFANIVNSRFTGG